MSKFSEFLEPLKERFGTTKNRTNSKDVLLFLMFVCIAFVFWLLLSLDNEVQRDFDVPVAVTECPDSVTVITNIPSTLNVSVKGKGSQLVRFLWSKNLPQMKFKFADHLRRNGQFYVAKSRLEMKLREYFGAGVQIMSCRPDSLKMQFTSRPGQKLPLKIVADVHPKLQYIVSGPIEASVDSVTVYSINGVPRGLTEIKTEPLVRSELKDTSRYEVRVVPVGGMRIVPDVVTVTVPVEPLISKKRTVRIEAANVPQGMSMVVFPGTVEVSYLVPMSDYSSDIPVRVYADFNEMRSGVPKIPLTLSMASGMAQNASLAIDSVEYILEHVK